MPITGKHLTIISFIIIIITSEWLKVLSSHGHPELNLSLAASSLGDLGNPSLPGASSLLCTRVGSNEAGALPAHRCLCDARPGPAHTPPL